MVKKNIQYINPYSDIIGKSVEKLCEIYSITFLDVQSRYLARINRPDYVIHGEESLCVKGSKKNVARFSHAALTPRKNLEKIIS